MSGRPKDDADPDPTMEQEFFIGGWDPYLVEITKVKRDKPAKESQRWDSDRRTRKDRRKK